MAISGAALDGNVRATEERGFWERVRDQVNPFDGGYSFNNDPYAGGYEGTITGPYDSSTGELVNQPSIQNPFQTTNNGGDPSGTSYLSGSGTQSAYSQDDVNYLNDQESQLRRLLQSAQATRDSGLTQLSDSFNRESSKANTQRSRELENLQLEREDTRGSKNKALGTVDDNAYNLANSVRRLLGLASGTGSSAYQLAAPRLIASEASGQRSNVLNTYGQNERNIGLTEDRAKSDFERLLDELGAKRKSAESGFRADVLSQEQGINESLADVARRRALLQGGGYDNVRQAQAPYLQNINSAQDTMDSLFSKYRSPFTSVQPVEVNAPNLADYTVDRAAINANRNQGNSPYSPYMQFLRGRDEEERR